MNLFLDTNIFLNFYHYSNDDLEQLKKLAQLIKNHNILLLSTDQIQNEYQRNRENKISDALKSFKEQRIPNQFPQICKQYPEYEKLCEAVRNFEDNKKSTLDKIQTDIDNQKLAADTIITELFASATIFKINDEIIKKARDRYDLGNPPGKEHSYGDAVNWELLLENVKNKSDLFLISEDRDYYSKIHPNSPSDFLFNEWKRIKDSKIYIFKSLSDFFNEKFPTIKLETEEEKDKAIIEFANSRTFDMTHKAINKLRKYSEFSAEQVRKIIVASDINDQIFLIKDDPDVKAFLKKIINEYRDQIDDETLSSFNLRFLYFEKEFPHEFDIPF